MNAPYMMVFLPLFSAILCLTHAPGWSFKCVGATCKPGPSGRAYGIIGSMLVALAGILSTAMFLGVMFGWTPTESTDVIYHHRLHKWLSFSANGEDSIYWSIYLDKLSLLMVTVVNVASAVVHIYSLSYMREDEGLVKFMGYISLFTFCMLMLVTADNFIQVFFGWEGVGVCSYLLIGFWYKKDTANAAAIKAFITNRVGDGAFIAGIAILYRYSGSFEFSSVFEVQHQLMNISIGYGYNLLDAACLLLFIGAMGKSAQIGLHVWLPDAMEGPTPVSALIHAATMVTAGVFLLARCSYLFSYSEAACNFVIIIGSITAIFAGLVAMCQTDIKKIIAYSTCSQLGYMFIACGVCAYGVGVFHLFTHAFFKAMLFLSAGIVIHAVHEQDIEKMGGLRKHMPMTYVLFWIGSLAIIGIYPFAGFFSKDAVLMAAYEKFLAGNHVAFIGFVSGIVAALFTALYSMKIIVKVFHGELRINPAHAVHHSHDAHHGHAHEKKHEEPKYSEYDGAMFLPMIVLVIGSVFAGLLGHKWGMDLVGGGYFGKSIFSLEHAKKTGHIDELIERLPLIVGLGGIACGIFIFTTTFSQMLAQLLRPVYKLIKNKFFFDEIYNCTVVFAVNVVSGISNWIDMMLVDFCVSDLTTFMTKGVNSFILRVHSGKLDVYALYTVFGVIIILLL